jgi:hypothetical protein
MTDYARLADDLERLCCAETEGKFFDYVTDSIGQIIAGLRDHARCSAGIATPADEDQMMKISELITRLQSTKNQFGDTCVYIRRGGLAWGAVALNRRDDDKKHGVFDIQAQHDRDMLQRAEQVERLKASRDAAESRLREAFTLNCKNTKCPLGGTPLTVLPDPVDGAPK